MLRRRRYWLLYDFINEWKFCSLFVLVTTFQTQNNLLFCYSQITVTSIYYLTGKFIEWAEYASLAHTHTIQIITFSSSILVISIFLSTSVPRDYEGDKSVNGTRMLLTTEGLKKFGHCVYVIEPLMFKFQWSLSVRDFTVQQRSRLSQLLTYLYRNLYHVKDTG